MGFFSRAKKIIKPAIDVPRWIDYRNLSETTHFLLASIKKLFIPATPKYRETFEEATKRLRLSEEDILRRQKEFYYLAWFYFVIAMGCYSYMIYLFYRHASWLAGLMSFSIASVLMAYAFRSRFWYFQIKTRRLGYTFTQWYKADIKGVHHDKV